VTDKAGVMLPDDFRYSQASLQDFVECPRRFLLRHVLRRPWPAPDSEPMLENESHLRLGRAFHHLVRQHVLGLPPEQLSRAVLEPELRTWWKNYLLSPPSGLPQERYAEVTLSGSAADRRLVAKYDLLAVERGVRIAIVDWKTSRRRPRRSWLAKRLQTRVYPWLLVCAGAHLNGGQAIRPEQVEMVYWFAQEPEAPERFHYGEAQYRQDREYLVSLVRRIEELAEDDFVLTEDERACRYCRYRSLCDRGSEAGHIDEPGWDRTELGESDFALDFRQAVEMEL